ncbi:MerR family transcriptional regulator [Enterococcus sp. LJL128]
MKKYLSVSEMAEYAGVSRRTLIYYDQIDLFKPKKTGDNGYRYYSFDQYAELDVILILKALNMSLEDIAAFLKQRNPEYTLKELGVQREKVRERITNLKQIEGVLDEYIHRYEKIRSVDFEVLTYDYREKEYYVVSDMIDHTDEPSAFQVYSHFYSLIQSRDIFSGYPIGFLTEGSDFEQRDIHSSPYRALIRIPEERRKVYPNNLVIEKPAGYYVSGFVRDDIHHLVNFSERFKKYLNEQNLVINGDIWELMWQDEVATASKEQQIFEVMLPVKSMN